MGHFNDYNNIILHFVTGIGLLRVLEGDGKQNIIHVTKGHISKVVKNIYYFIVFIQTKQKHNLTSNTFDSV